MPARFYSETAAVLFARRPELEEVAALVPSATRRTRAASGSIWFGSEDLVVTIDAARNGRLVIDVVRAPWPDAMGPPDEDPVLFGAWTLGAFGRLASPDGLARAVEQAWELPGASDLVRDHVAFVRLRTTYVIGAGDDAPISPEGRSSRTDLDAILEAASALLTLDGALASFDPHAELLLPRATIESVRADAAARHVAPIQLYAHVRRYRTHPGFSLMDTVGMERFELPDLELPFADAIDPQRVARFLHDTCLAALERGAPIPSGDTIEGPEGRYRVQTVDHSAEAPLRRVSRLRLER